MENIKTLYITGYKSFEIGVFQDKDPKITIIKKVLKSEIETFIANGLEWVLISGNLGTEIWAAEVVLELKKEFPEIKLGILYPFKDFGASWNTKNKEKLANIEAHADYINAVSHQPYQSPAQLNAHTRFILAHSGATLMIYDNEYPGKAQFFYQEALKFSEKESYEIRAITMDDLQSTIQE